MSGLNGSNSKETASTELSIEERKGAIVIWFGDTYVILPPDQALGIGEILLRYAHHAKTGKEIKGEKVISDMIKRKIENRVMVVMANLEQRKKRPEFIAKEIVDIVLREAL